MLCTPNFGKCVLYFEIFGKLHVICSKVGGKIWRREGYIARENSCKLEVIHIMFRLIIRQQDPTWVRRSHHDQAIILLPEGDILRAQHLDCLSHGAQLGYQLPGQHQVILMGWWRLLSWPPALSQGWLAFDVCLLKTYFFAFKCNFIKESFLGCL